MAAEFEVTCKSYAWPLPRAFEGPLRVDDPHHPARLSSSAHHSGCSTYLGAPPSPMPPYLYWLRLLWWRRQVSCCFAPARTLSCAVVSSTTSP